MACFVVHLTLLVPELIWPEPADRITLGKLHLPALEKLLARGQLVRRPSRPVERVLAESFGYPANAPFGHLRLQGEATTVNDDDAHWLCADPVHLRFHHERIVLADAGAFELSEDEADALIASLNSEFADIGRFQRSTARRWYLRLHAPVEHCAEPLSAVAGRRVDSELSNSPLSRWLNEVQMFLHLHPVNQRREQRGLPAVNSLWLWGAPAQPVTVNPPFSSVFSANPLSIGLARQNGLPIAPAPATLAELPATAGERPLVVLEGLLDNVLYENSEGWRAEIEALEQNWFAPLLRSQCALTLIAPSIYGELHYTLSGLDRWKCWIGGKTLSTVATTLAESAP